MTMHLYFGNPWFIEDEDDDVSYTARVDVDGATVRPWRPVVSHVADGLRNAEFTGHDRLEPDRYRLRSSRQGRNRNVGQRFLVRFESSRAGECFALDAFHVELSVEGERRVAADTTSRTDVDGATLRIPPFSLALASEDARNAALASLAVTAQDRFVTRFAPKSTEAKAKRFRLTLETDGRAGNAWALDKILLDLSPEGEAHPATET